MKYLFGYQRGKVISEQKRIILEQVTHPILPESIVPCPTDPKELSNFIQVDSTDSPEAKFYLQNVKISNAAQGSRNDYEILKSQGVKFKLINPKFATKYKSISNYFIESLQCEVSVNNSNLFIFKDINGKYILPENLTDNKPEYLTDYKKRVIEIQNNKGTIDFAIFNPIKQVCLRAATNTSNPTTQQEPTQQVPSKPTPMKQQCGFDLSWVQTEPTEENNFVMYEIDGINVNNLSGPFTIECDAFMLPDMFYIKYGESEVLSPFKGGKEMGKDKYLNQLLEKQQTIITNVNNKIAQLGGKLTCGSKNFEDINESRFTEFMYKRPNDTLKIIVFSPLGKEVPRSFTVNLLCGDK